MNDTLIKFGIAGISGVFSAGVTWGVARTKLSRLKHDVNCIGQMMRANERDAHRRYLNLTHAVLVAAPEDKEAQISALLKE